MDMSMKGLKFGKIKHSCKTKEMIGLSWLASNMVTKSGCGYIYDDVYVTIDNYVTYAAIIFP